MTASKVSLSAHDNSSGVFTPEAYMSMCNNELLSNGKHEVGEEWNNITKPFVQDGPNAKLRTNQEVKRTLRIREVDFFVMHM